MGCTKEEKGQIEDIDPEDVKVFTMFCEDQNFNYEYFESPVAQEITRKTGVKLDIEYPVMSVEEKTSIMIASGDYPDFIFVKDTAQFADIKAYTDLTDLISTYGPNIYKVYEDYWNRLKYSEEDPSIYVLPSAPVTNEQLEPNMGFQLQHAVVKELGYPDIKTVHDFEDAIRRYMKLHPQIDGEETIGITLLADDWRWLVTIGNGAAFATGKPDDGQWYIEPDTKKATYRFLRPEEREYFRWLNHMYNTGLIDPDSFVQNYQAYEAKIMSGRVLGLIDAKWQYERAERILNEQGKFIRAYGQYPVQLNNSTRSAEFRKIDYEAGYGVGMSVNCQDVQRGIKFLDYMASEEGQVLRNWGIEGEHYYMDSQGKRKIFPWEKEARLSQYEYSKRTGISVYVYPFTNYGLGMLDSTGNPYSITNELWVKQGYNPIEEEVLKAYGVETWKELYPSENQQAASSWGRAYNMPLPKSAEIQELLNSCDAVVKQSLVNAIIAIPEDFDVIWEDMLQQLDEIGVDVMNERFTKLIRERVRVWGE